MGEVFVIAAELSGKFTGRPHQPLGQMMMAAAARALHRAALDAQAVDAVFTAAMGNFEPEGFVGPIPMRLANTLGLSNAEVTPILVSSSEIGAWALKQAYESCRRHPQYRRVLVVAGEQMNPLASQPAESPEERLAERIARTRAIGEVLDEPELRYGFNLVRMGDLLMDAIAHGEGWSAEAVTEVILPLIAMTKYERIGGYRLGHFHGRIEPDLADYRSRSRITRFFNLHDVTPTSSGAVALILSREPVGNALEIMGMGQALVPLSLTARRGDIGRSHSARNALIKACLDAGVGIDWLLDADFAVVHDAFPSIEYAFLKELGLGPSEIVTRATTGWSNPFGGLKTCGHALGASGLLQVAKVFHRIFRDPVHLTEAALADSPPAQRGWTSSVGGPLTNVVVSLLRRHGAADAASTAPSAADLWDPYSDSIEPAYQALREQIPPRSGLVVARTRLVHTPAFGDDDVPLFRRHRAPWILLLERAPADADSRPKCYAFAEDERPIGALCRLRPQTIEGESYLRAGEVLDRLDLAADGERDGRSREMAATLAELRQRLARFDLPKDADGADERG